MVPDGATAAAGGQGGSAEEGPAAEGGQAQGLPEGCGGPTTEIPGQPSGYTPFVGPLCSQDGKAAIVTAYLKGEGEGDKILDPVKFWRDTVSDPGGGLEVKITGGAGYAADAIEVFESHQRHAAAGCDHAGDRPADPDLPVADLPVRSAGGGHLRGDPRALARAMGSPSSA